MPIVRYVAFFPPTGRRGRAWVTEPACDALVKSGRRVAELYSAEVSSLQLQGKASEIRIFVRPAPPEQPAVAVTVHLDFAESFESAVALVPASVAAMSPQTRAEVAMEVLAGSVHALAPHRGWPQVELERAEQASRAQGLEFIWHSPWKSSPDRRREARATFWLEDHGHGRTVIEVRDRSRADAAIVHSPQADAFCTSAGFARSAKTLRWNGDEVAMVPSIGLLGREGRRVSFDPASGSTEAGWSPIGLVSRELGAIPDVEVSASHRVPEAHEIRFIGGGPTNGVPLTYQHGLAKHLTRLSEDGLPWWPGADRHLLEVTFRITEGDAGVKVRRLKDRVTAVIHRPRGTFNLLNGGRLAREDVRALVESVSTRLHLSDPPTV